MKRSEYPSQTIVIDTYYDRRFAAEVVKEHFVKVSHELGELMESEILGATIVTVNIDIDEAEKISSSIFYFPDKAGE